MLAAALPAALLLAATAATSGTAVAPSPPPFSCPSGRYCGSCPAGYKNWDSIHLMLGNGSPGLKQFHANVDAAVATFRKYPGIHTDDAKDTHMSVQYLCCLNVTQMATTRKIVGSDLH